MTIFTDKEHSLSQGAPIRLYEIRRDDRHWYYTNADHEIVFDGFTYAPIPIADDGIRQTGQAAADTLTMTVPDDLPIAKYLAGYAISSEIWLTIRDTHWGLPDQPDSALVVWIGTVASAKWEKIGQVEIACTSLSASMGRMGLRLTYERNCPHCLFDSSCRIDRNAWVYDTTITALDGASITVADLPAPPLYYIGGYIIWIDSEGFAEQRSIENRVGKTLTMLTGTAGLTVGQQIMVFPGCNQTSEMCDSLYGNIYNYGGFRHMPGKSPFEAMIFY